MKHTFHFSSIALTLTGVLISGSVFAKCPPELKGDELKFCLAVEGTGKDYMQFLKERAEERENAQYGAVTDDSRGADVNDPGWIRASGGGER